MKKYLLGVVAIVCICAALFAGAVVYLVFFSSPSSDAKTEYVTIPLGMSTAEAMAKLEAGGFVTHITTLRVLFGARSFFHGIAAGGYALSKNMSAWQVASVLASPPYLHWVIIPEGLRKEEMAELLAGSLGWDANAQKEFLEIYKILGDGYFEGVYFPDTYLTPADGDGEEMARRMIGELNEKLAPYSKELARQNIKWDTALKLASIVQREAAGEKDMPLIAGILWNRLLQGMRLQVDATVQYARGKTAEGWWAPLKAGETKLESPYNTYLRTGLPPHPIANPGIEAIDSVMYPAKTSCLYYLHDNDGVIHCAATFEGHRANIEKYLKGT